MKPQSILLALILSGLTIFGLSAQNFDLSPKVGISISTLDETFEETQDYKFRTGWNLGMDGRFGSGAFVFHPGIHFNKYSVDLRRDIDDDPDFDLSDESSISTLRAPVTAGFFLTGEDGLLRIHVRGGATPIWILSVNEKEPFDFNKDALNELTVYGNVSLGIDFAIVTLDISYEWGLADYFENFDEKNRQFIITAGLVL